MKDLAFFSFEHYPYDPCKIPWSVLYDEPELMRHIIQVWHEDGVPADVPMFVTEGNLSSGIERNLRGYFRRHLAGRLHRIVARRGRQGGLLLPLSAFADGAGLQQFSGHVRHVLPLTQSTKFSSRWRNFLSRNSSTWSGRSPEAESIRCIRPSPISRRCWPRTGHRLRSEAS